MDRNLQKIGLTNLLAFLLVGAAAQFVARYANSATGQAGVIFLGLGLLVAAVSYFQMRLETRERLEKLEFDELKKAPDSAALFTQETETFPAKHSREQFERFFVPAFAVLLFILQCAAVYWLWGWLRKVTPPVVDRATIVMALSALFALVLYLLGKYAAGIARLEGQRLLQPGAGYMLLGAATCVLMAAAEAAAWFGFLRVDYYIACGLAVIVGLAAVEMLASLVLEIYRPRVKGQPVRLLYESRLVGLLGQPTGLITTAAQALDYQFGFKVSETWFYQLLERAFAWLILLQLGVLFLSTILVIIEPTETGLLERFGQPLPNQAVLEPGLHFKWPWPIDKVYRFHSREIQTIYVGFIPDPDLANEKTVLWTKPHFKEEFNLLVASRDKDSDNPSAEQAVPVNFLSVNIPIQYRIKDARAWAYNYSDAAQLLENIANREVVRYLVNVDIEELMTAGRFTAAETLRKRIQSRTDERRMGVEVVFVGLEGIHPPVSVAPAYQEVVGALQEKETNILAAQAYWAERIPLAEAQATNIVAEAKSDAFAKVTAAAAQASQFTNQLAAFQAAPAVYTQRSYLEALARSLGPIRKYVLATTNTQDIIWLNLEDKLRPDLLDIPVASPKK